VKRRQRGFSLIETVIFIIVLSLGIAGLVAVFFHTSMHGHEPYLQQRALAVASAYMDEILHKRWDESSPVGGGCVETGSGICAAWCAGLTYPDCRRCNLGVGVCSAPMASGSGAEEGTNRGQFDDIDDYNGLSETPPLNALGAPMSGAGAFSGFSAAVTVGHPAAAWNGVAAAEVKRIEVEVSTPDGQTIALNAYRLNF